MNLSILIPIYNWDVTLLYERLLDEIDGNNLSSEVEIIFADDFSTVSQVIDANSKIAKNEREYVSFNYMGRNIGRSGIRNWLAQRSKGKYLLFLDCDVLPDRDDFISNYLNCILEDNYDVVCGGRSYKSRVLADKEYDYHEYFGNKKEVKSAEKRNLTPWRYILTSNIMIRKSAYECTPFNEAFVGYGYEDVEWGIKLSKSYRIKHISNTASHLGLVSKRQVYEKMRESVHNYLLLKKLFPEAFKTALISRFVDLFGYLNTNSLKTLDAVLGYFFFQKWINKWTAFVAFQLNFAVILAMAINKSKD